MSIDHRQANRQLIVRRLSARSIRGVVEYGNFVVPCALGRSGTRALKTEGDGATPRGVFALGTVFFNPRAGRRFAGRLPTRPLSPKDGWCDAVEDGNYNRPVKLPYRARAERMWRDDGLYDVVVVVDYNMRPRVRGRGSAIFIHVARDGFLPTEGCVALKRDALRRLAPHFSSRTRLVTRV